MQKSCYITSRISANRRPVAQPFLAVLLGFSLFSLGLSRLVARWLRRWQYRGAQDLPRLVQFLLLVLQLV
jgi:hypothetical protein